ncbi:HAD family hydrolase [Aspergillus chevalieri]|uniref:Uncharacterized protein n=1 Tax=Aspergillus chevalieri TaxID=182096 RepID=A0A7R7VXI7_ASPCH|nr:uncharacterized protein ACHE_80502A [Aspergillus chevalieri]BCR92602.1 hypothetical protein ACHE_80502A [Aspergillus chevalieri]
MRTLMDQLQSNFLMKPSLRITIRCRLFFDADKTLAADDTGARFWERIKETKGKDDPLSTLFGGPLKYSYTAFRQAMLLYEESTNDDEFDAICEEVATYTHLYPQICSLLRQEGRYHHV